ncbi:MAG TPA: methyltransferase [Blastocatellia bacterium]|nr:methyltransferase [Blastocatellia bacterium]
MTQPVAVNAPKPPMDERPLWDLLETALAYKAVLVAHSLGLFPLLADGPRTTAEICEALKIARRPATALLATGAATGLVAAHDGHYSLTPLAQTYLLESSPYYFGSFLNMLIANDEFTSFECTKQAVLTDRSQVYSGEEIFKSHEAQIALAQAFTHGMHGHSAGAAHGWPEVVDLSGCRLMLDVGGGSGAHAIGAAQRWPHLRAVIFDMPPVCEVAEGYIACAGLDDRITTHAGDLWNDPFPPADVHFYADIYHDWPPEKGRFLTKKSFDSLNPGGRIIIHERLYNDEKTGPLATAAYAVAMLLWTEGQQYSGRELTAMLAEAGFTDIEIKPSFSYWSVVTGRRP